MLLVFAVLAEGCMKDFNEDIHGADSECFDPGSGPAVQFGNPELEAFCLETLDIDGDRCIRMGEIDGVTKLDCSGRGMTSLEGIEVFPSLDTLVCPDNCLESLNLSLTKVSVLFADPMDDAAGHNLLKYVYVRRGQEIEYVTSNRKDAPERRIPDETVVISVPVSN